MCNSPYKKAVRELAESVFNLQKADNTQLDLFEDVTKKENLTKAIDEMNEKYGDYMITPARMLGMKDVVIDRITFGTV